MATNKRRKKKKVRLSGFGKFLAIYCSALGIIAVILLFVLHGLLKDYEESIPDSAMENVLENFSVKNIENVVKNANITVSEFETTDYVVNYLKDKLNSGETTFRRKSGEFTNKTPVYVVFAGETPIARVSLVDKGDNGWGFTTWKLGEVKFDGFVDASGSVEITAPAGAVVSINGVQVKDNYITETKAVEATKNVGSYATAAQNKVIKIDGLMTTPNVSAKLDGKDLLVSWNKRKCVISYPTDDAFLAKIKDRALLIGEEYGEYLINRGSLDSLQSYMVGHAAELVSDIPAIWAYLYGKRFTYEFKNEEVFNAIKYNDNCYSVSIKYDLYVNYGDGDITYPTAMNYTFVNTRGNWYLADFTNE